MNTFKLLSTTNYLIYNLEIAKKLSPSAAILLGLLSSQFVYWEEKGELVKGYFYCTRETIYTKSGLSEDIQRTALKLLQSVGIVETMKIGIPAKLYYKLNETAIITLLTSNDHSLGNTDGCSGKNRGQLWEKPSQLVSNINKEINKEIILPKGNTPPSENVIEKPLNKPEQSYSKKEVINTPLPPATAPTSLLGLPKPETKQKETLSSVIDSFTEDPITRKTLLEFLSHYRQKKKMSPSIPEFKAMLLQLDSVNVSKSCAEDTQLINHAISKGWLSFWAIKTNQSYNQVKSWDTMAGQVKDIVSEEGRELANEEF